MARKRKPRVNDDESLPTDSAATAPTAAPTAVAPWSPRTKIIASGIAMLHLFVVFSAPWAMPQPSSELARDTAEWTSPWANLMYMQHGYRFFAPDPGPSHLIHFEVTQQNGEVVKGKFPNRNQHRPRLMYHRFFMISEHFWGLGSSQVPTSQKESDELRRAENHLRENGFQNQADWLGGQIVPPDSDVLKDEDIEAIVSQLKNGGKHHAARTAEKNLKAQQMGMALAKRHKEVWLAGIVNYLKQKHNGVTVRIWIQEHMIPDYDHILDGGKLDDAENFGPRQLVYSDDEEI